MNPSRRLGLRLGALLVALASVVLSAGTAFAHEERDPQTPTGSGHVPSYRESGPTLLVCKSDPADFTARIAGFSDSLRALNQRLWTQCQASGFRDIQAAVDKVERPGTIIKILPGIYQEEPSLADTSFACSHLNARQAALGYQILSWEQQVACPHNQNLIAVLDKKDLQIEGVGAEPKDVVIDAQYRRLNALRADRSSGIYLRNFIAQRSTFNAIYIMEADGFAIDHVIGRWNDEYGFLTFADDHGLYTDCEAYGNGDSGIYPGAASDLNAKRGDDVLRYAIEVKNCTSHDNLLGYSGTAGDSVWAHDNKFINNSAGVSTDSAFPNHPGLPQNHAKFERNIIADNNSDYYRYVRDGTCRLPYEQRGYESGVVCPAVGPPVGVGVLNPGGNYNIWADNWIYGNQYAGFVTSWVPAFIRNDTSLSDQFDTSHHNRYFDNHLGVRPDGSSAPNGMDFWWDGQGVGSCWQPPSSAGSDPLVLPRCGPDHALAGPGSARYISEPQKLLVLYTCANFDQRAQRIPSDCSWFGARGLQRIEVKYALGEALLACLLLLALWLRLRRRSRLALIGLITAAVGLAVGVLGTGYEASRLTPIGLAIAGCGYLTFGIFLSRRRPGALGGLTIAIGFFALLGAVDRGLYILPYLPVPPSLLRIGLELVALGYALRTLLAKRPKAAPTPPQPTPHPTPQP